jgi:hypothetical protein
MNESLRAGLDVETDGEDLDLRTRKGYRLRTLNPACGSRRTFPLSLKSAWQPQPWPQHVLAGSKGFARTSSSALKQIGVQCFAIGVPSGLAVYNYSKNKSRQR